MTEKDLFTELTVFDNYEVLQKTDGILKIRTAVTEKALNPYGTAHGGFLYSLCDTVAGGTAAILGDYTVTLQGNINYLKPANKDDILTVTGSGKHNGRKTKVIEVNVTDQNDQLICTSTFTMFVVGKIPEES